MEVQRNVPNPIIANRTVSPSADGEVGEKSDDEFFVAASGGPIGPHSGWHLRSRLAPRRP